LHPDAENECGNVSPEALKPDLGVRKAPTAQVFFLLLRQPNHSSAFSTIAPLSCGNGRIRRNLMPIPSFFDENFQHHVKF
jgi:hypothetical protein